LFIKFRYCHLEHLDSLR